MIVMKTSIVVALLTALSAGFSTREILQQRIDNVLRQLGIEQTEAREHIWWSFSSGYLSYPSAATLKKIGQQAMELELHEKKDQFMRTRGGRSSR
jgi:hypothetical protein